SHRGSVDEAQTWTVGLGIALIRATSGSFTVVSGRFAASSGGVRRSRRCYGWPGRSSGRAPPAGPIVWRGGAAGSASVKRLDQHPPGPPRWKPVAVTWPWLYWPGAVAKTPRRGAVDVPCSLNEDTHDDPDLDPKMPLPMSVQVFWPLEATSPKA